MGNIIQKIGNFCTWFWCCYSCRTVQLKKETLEEPEHPTVRPDTEKLLILEQFFADAAEQEKIVIIKPDTSEFIAQLLQETAWAEKMARAAKKTQRKTIPAKNETSLTKIMVVNTQKSGATDRFLKSFSLWLKRMGGQLIEISLEEMQDKNFVILLCNNHSRLIADAQATVTNVNEKMRQQMVLAILHIQKEKQLPSVSAKAQLAEANKFEDFRDVIDLAFDKDTEPEYGMYDCEMNRKSRKSIESIFFPR